MGKRKYIFKNPNHLVNLNNMRLSGQLCDVTIKVNDKEVKAHKNILAANLKYFQSMFLNSFQESKQDVVTMKNVEGDALEAFVCFAYTGEICFTEENALGLLEAADYFNEDIIKEACINFLTEHLNEEDACRVYQFATAIECLPLKDTAERIISMHFEKCSKTAEYFDFDIENLKNILSYVSSVSESEQSLFEGIVRWILHDVKSRRNHINDLLSFIDITKLSADYFIEYFCGIVNKQNDIAKDIMFFYREKMQELKQSENFKLLLMVIGSDNHPFGEYSYEYEQLHAQFYDFTKRKWCRPLKMLYLTNGAIMAWTILNNNFYYTFHIHESPEKGMQVFDLREKRNTKLSFDRRLRWHSMSTCSRFLYLCGGYQNGPSRLALRYDLQTDSFKLLPSMKSARAHPTSIFYQGCLYVLGGYSGSRWLSSIEKFDPDTEKWLDFPSMCESRHDFQVAELDGKLYACGGEADQAYVYLSSVETYDPSKNCWRLVAPMNKKRHEFLMVAHEEKLLAIGGDKENTVEIYDPSKDQWQIDRDLSSGLTIRVPRGGIVPASFAN